MPTLSAEAEITALGGSIAAFIELRPYLQKGAPPFTEPAGRFFRINLPPELPTAKDFATADALRKELTAAGWSMLDSKTDYKLEPLKK
jgi:cysteinyl-tRNA synthetase